MLFFFFFLHSHKLISFFCTSRNKLFKKIIFYVNTKRTCANNFSLYSNDARINVIKFKIYVFAKILSQCQEFDFISFLKLRCIALIVILIIVFMVQQ